MTRDIGQILAILQQQNQPIVRTEPKADWSPVSPEQHVLGDFDRRTIETRASCTLPTVNESQAEFRPLPKNLATQRSLDSASRLHLVYYCHSSLFNVFFVIGLEERA